MLDQAMGGECRRSLALCERRQAKILLEPLARLFFFRRHKLEQAHGELGVLREVAAHSAHVVQDLHVLPVAYLEWRLRCIHAPAVPLRRQIALDLAAVVVPVPRQSGRTADRRPIERWWWWRWWRPVRGDRGQEEPSDDGPTIARRGGHEMRAERALSVSPEALEAAGRIFCHAGLRRAHGRCGV